MLNIESLHKELPPVLPAEISDQMQFFLRKYTDQQMRLVVKFDEKINFDLLKKSFRLLIYIEPIFSYKYFETKEKAYWKKELFVNPDKLIDLVEVTENPENEEEKFLVEQVSPFEFPIVRGRIIRCNEKDTLCINMNHTPTDGAGLKEFTYMLAECYRILLKNPDFEPETNIRGDRSIKQVTKNISIFKRFSATIKGFKKPEPMTLWRFNWEKTGEEKEKHHLKISLTKEIFYKLKEFGKKHDATFNDTILAIYFRALAEFNTVENSTKIITIPVDLRKYIKHKNPLRICNLTSTMICNIGTDIGNTLTDTIIKVRDNMLEKKKHKSELSTIFPIVLLGKLFNYSKLKSILSKIILPPIPLLTNIGIIDQNKLKFGNLKVTDSYIWGAIPINDSIMLSFTTFCDSLTFSVGFIGEENQNKIVKLFFKKLESEINSIP